jgi:hypothetical protein
MIIIVKIVTEEDRENKTLENITNRPVRPREGIML